MNKKYIKRPIPEEISEDGGASVVFVDKETVPLDGSIADALAGNYCTGNKVLIQNLFFGLMRSMAEGVVRDGHARQIGDFLTVYPVFKGEIDLDKGFDPVTNYIQVRARLLNEMELDITDWVFQDVTPGRRAFKLSTVKAGETDGVYVLGQVGELNGKDMPSTKAGETLRIDWAVEGTALSGTITAAKAASDVSRADIAADALAALNVPANDGKTIVFTVRGNFANAKISAVLKYVPPVPRTVTVTGERSGKNDSPNMLHEGYAAHFDGTNLDTVESVTWKDESATEGASGTVAAANWSANAAGTVLTLDDTVALAIKASAGASAILKFTFTSHGGVPGSAEQSVSLGGLVIGA